VGVGQGACRDYASCPLHAKGWAVAGWRRPGFVSVRGSGRVPVQSGVQPSPLLVPTHTQGAGLSARPRVAQSTLLAHSAPRSPAGSVDRPTMRCSGRGRRFAMEPRR
jgi:hypothetical protein